jgi:hypothetical protein
MTGPAIFNLNSVIQKIRKERTDTEVRSNEILFLVS